MIIINVNFDRDTQKMFKLKNNHLIAFSAFLVGFIFSALIIINCKHSNLQKKKFWKFFFDLSYILLNQVNLSFYELEASSGKLEERMHALHSYFNKFSNLSFPIAYSLQFYENYHEMPIIYIITPTDNKRPTQMADLTRMRNTLWLVPKIVWILIEDSNYKTNKLTR